MTNISKQKTDSKDFKEAEKQLITLIAKLNKHTAQFLISDLLSESEQVMIIKRFAAVFMFEHGYSPYRVSDTLSISSSTARRIYLQYQNKQFGGLLHSLSKIESDTFLSFLNDLILAQASPRARTRLYNKARRS